MRPGTYNLLACLADAAAAAPAPGSAAHARSELEERSAAHPATANIDAQTVAQRNAYESCIGAGRASPSPESAVGVPEDAAGFRAEREVQVGAALAVA